MKKNYYEKIKLFWNKSKELIVREFLIITIFFVTWRMFTIVKVKTEVLVPVAIFFALLTIGNVNSFLIANYTEFTNSIQKINPKTEYFLYILINVLRFLFVIAIASYTMFICYELEVKYPIMFILCLYTTFLTLFMTDTIILVVKKRHEMFIELHSKEKEVLSQPKEDNKI